MKLRGMGLCAIGVVALGCGGMEQSAVEQTKQLCVADATGQPFFSFVAADRFGQFHTIELRHFSTSAEGVSYGLEIEGSALLLRIADDRLDVSFEGALTPALTLQRGSGGGLILGDGETFKMNLGSSAIRHDDWYADSFDPLVLMLAKRSVLIELPTSVGGCRRSDVAKQTMGVKEVPLEPGAPKTVYCNLLKYVSCALLGRHLCCNETWQVHSCCAPNATCNASGMAANCILSPQ